MPHRSTLAPFGARRLELLAAAAKPQLERQVFISHTGQDEAAKTFAASILSPALGAAGLNTYIDFSDLKPGCIWPRELVAAAANSAVFVAVLSKRYYTRYWCMLELDLARNAQTAGLQRASHTATSSRAASTDQRRMQPFIIPVFYDAPEEVIPVRPCLDNVQQPRKVVRQWCDSHVRKLLDKDEELSREWVDWVNAEEWTANLVAMKGERQNLRRVKKGPKDQDLQLARRVVAAAVQEIPPLLALPPDLVGAKQEMARLLSGLTGRLGLWLSGPGGLGKSTMAKALRNWLAGSFSHSAFISLEVGNGRTQEAAHLAAALTALTGTNHQGSVEELLPKLEEFVKGKKVLYVLDNVGSGPQLDRLLPVTWGDGSVVIVTSRNANFEVDSNSWLQVKAQLLRTQVQLLDTIHSRRLLRRAAGLTGPPQQAGLLQPEDAILAVCNGLPLALRLAGGALRGKNTVQEWQDVHMALKQGRVAGDTEFQLQRIVTLSLTPEMHPARASMFLDVATLLKGQPASSALAVWCKWWGPSATTDFEDLERSSLVGVDDEGRLTAHDMLVALGRGIVRNKTPNFEEHWGSRVWLEDNMHVGYQQAQGTRQGHGCKVVAAMLHCAGSSTCGSLHPLQLAAQLDLSEVRVLWLHGLALPPCGKVLWLHIKEGDVSPWLQLQNDLVLVAAEEQQVVHLPDSLPALRNLTCLDLSWSSALASLPESFGELSALKQLNLLHCRMLARLPDSFGQLQALTRLNLRYCKHLAVLPDFVGQLRALEQLQLSGCEQLARLPESFGNLSALQQLEMSGCERLACLPPSFGQLIALQRLDLGYCERLASLPESFGELLVLQWLDLSFCTQLVSLPESFGQLAALQELHMRSCNQLTSLRESFGDLPELRRLQLSGSKQLCALPESFGRLAALQRLQLRGCECLAEVPDLFGHLKGLQQLDLSDCRQLTSLPESFGQLAALQRLQLSDCQQLASLPDSFGQLQALAHVDLSNCKQLASLPDTFGQLSALRKLDLTNCQQLANLPDSFGQLPALQQLDLGGCTQLASLPESLGKLQALQWLSLRECEQLISLPESFGQLMALQELQVSGCVQLARLPESCGRLTALRQLELVGCYSLQRPLPVRLEALLRG